MTGHLPEVAAERAVAGRLVLHVLERAFHLALRFGELRPRGLLERTVKALLGHGRRVFHGRLGCIALDVRLLFHCYAPCSKAPEKKSEALRFRFTKGPCMSGPKDRELLVLLARPP